MKRHTHQRGMALLLVMVSVAVVTVMTLSFIARQDADTAISDNTEARTAARFNAESGVELASAIMECDDLDWRTAHVNGVLIDNYDFGGGTLTVRVSDVNGNPPDADTDSVILEASAEKGKLRNRRRALVYAPRSDGEIDVDLSEFAVFAQESIFICESQVRRAAASPAAASSSPIRLGVNSTASGAIALGTAARVSEGEAIFPGNAPMDAVEIADSLASLDKRTRLGFNAIPVPKAPSYLRSGYSNPMSAIWTVTSGEWWVTEPKWFDTITVMWSAHLKSTIDCPRVILLGDLHIKNGGSFTATGDFDLIVEGDLWLSEDAFISRVAGTNLRIFVGGRLIVEEGSVIGITRSNVDSENLRDDDEFSRYQNPEQCVIYQIADSPESEWTISGSSIICGQIYAPNANVTLTTSSKMLGNIVGRSVEITNDALLYWDPALDNQSGYMGAASLLVTEAGELHTAIASLVDLNESTLITVKNAIDAAPGDAGGGNAGGGSSPRNRSVDLKWIKEDDHRDEGENERAGRGG
ncbi:MAG: DUF7305 domain-containing protein [Planctomycetota bacterium]